MTTLHEAAQQALEALEWYAECSMVVEPAAAAMNALRAALAEPVQEPVAWLFTNLQSGEWDFCYCEDEHDHDREMWHRQPLYTAPPQRKPLPEDEIALIVADCSASAHRHDDFSFARAIERAHGIT